jgi:hypothetical protein
VSQGRDVDAQMIVRTSSPNLTRETNGLERMEPDYVLQWDYLVERIGAVYLRVQRSVADAEQAATLPVS